ncbi:MAG: GDSL-type esterase/lipase family protein, partial [Deltaproteobacteria bacterium]
ARNPTQVAGLYNDAPVCDFKSWPGGKGKGKGSRDDWKRCLAAYGLTEEQALEYKLNPVDNLAPLAKAKVPLLHVCGTADDVVPFEENTQIVAERYRAMGGPITVIAKPGVGHHPHSLQNPSPIVAFVLQHTPPKSPEAILMNARRIVFLGDSITAAGPYVAYFDAWLVSRRLEQTPHVIDAGLPSETVSGLSEEGHAGGKFPRPDLAERLDRVLAVTKPDLVIACYGINCGIYEPFDKGRFERYQRGMTQVKSKVEKAGAKFVVMTPPFYDDKRAPKAFSYNEVLGRYSDWLLEQRKEGWQVVDLHGPMTREVQKRRAADPQFTFQPDGVHPNDAGHWFVARQLIQWFGDEKAAAAANPKEMLTALGVPETLLPLVQQRVNLLRDAYVAAAGHKRPGVAAGLPVPEAEKQAGELSAKIRNALADAK